MAPRVCGTSDETRGPVDWPASRPQIQQRAKLDFPHDSTTKHIIIENHCGRATRTRTSCPSADAWKKTLDRSPALLCFLASELGTLVNSSVSDCVHASRCGAFSLNLVCPVPADLTTSADNTPCRECLQYWAKPSPLSRRTPCRCMYSGVVVQRRLDVSRSTSTKRHRLPATNLQSASACTSRPPHANFQPRCQPLPARATLITLRQGNRIHSLPNV